MRICMFVYNNCTTDARVLKEAGTLRDAGHDVLIVAVLDATTTLEEDREGLRIVRIDRRPLHYRLLWWYRRLRRSLRLRRATIKRSLRRRARRMRWRTRRGRIRVRRLARRTQTRALRACRRLLRTIGRLQSRGSKPLVRAVARVLPPAVVRALRRRSYRLRRALRSDLAMAHDPDAPPDAVALRRRVLPAPVVRALRLLGRLVILPMLAVLWLLGQVYRGISHVVYRTLMRFHKPLMFGDWYWRSYRLLRGERFDVLHAHDLNTLPVAVALKRRTGARLIYDAHELYPEVSTLSRTESRVWRVLERALIKRADDVITVCESIAGELQARHAIVAPTILLNCPPTRLGVEPLPHLLRAHAGLDDDGPIVLYQGGFAPNRGLPQLVRAAAYLERGRLILMGWGKLESQLREIVQEEALGARVTIVGPVPPGVLLAYTAGADVGVIPYEPIGLNNTYTMPNKLFEYLSVGLPIVGSHLPELVRVLLGCEVGLTFARVEPELIAASLNLLLGDDELRAQMGANALRVRELYTWERQAEVLLGVYDGALSQPQLTPAA